MMDYYNIIPTIITTNTNQRRNSSPDCLSHFKTSIQNGSKFQKMIYRHSFSTLTSSTTPLSFIRPFSDTISSSSSSSLPAAPTIKKKRKRLMLTKEDSMLLTPPDSPMLMLDYHIPNNDIELATEIGQGLLSEVRRMQTVLSERQETIHQLENDKQETQSRMNELIRQLRFKAEIEERLKQDIWDLELSKQELTQHISQLSSTLYKQQTEHQKREQQQWQVQQEFENLQDSLQLQMEQSQLEYETKLNSLHESLSMLKKEKSMLNIELEQLQKINTQLVHQVQQETKKNQKPLEEEIQLLKMSLAQAHHLVETLKVDLENERQKKLELDILLRESQETIESQIQDSSVSSHISLQQEIMISEQKLHQQDFKQIIMFTMVGDWVLKYTSSKFKTKAHQRFFWLHPYTNTLYWSQYELGHGNKTKSVSIESFTVQEQENQEPVIVIQSSTRDIKIQCLTKASHEKWIQSLNYLLKQEKTNEKRLSLLLTDL